MSSPNNVNDDVPFLNFPGEIRNKIYEYVLDGGPKGLTVSYHGKDPRRLRRKPRRHRFSFTTTTNPCPNRACNWCNWRAVSPYSVNRLKYVCKQLREETEHLELEYNTITFHNPTHFKMFSSTFSSKDLGRCKGIIIIGDRWAVSGGAYKLTDRDAEAYACTAHFCRVHRVPVRYEFIGWHPESSYFLRLSWRYDPWQFFEHGIMLNYVLRGRDLTSELLPPDVAPLSRDFGEEILQGRDRSVWQAENLRFFPEKSAFYEDDFRRECGRFFSQSEEYTDHLSLVDEWVGFARSWFEEGI